MEFLSDIKCYLTPLRKASMDKENRAPLIDTDDLVYNFDGITKQLCKKLQRKETLASCDALLKRDEQYYFLEFKNQPQVNIDLPQMAKKAFQSFQLFRLAIEQDMSVEQARDHLTLFVIYADKDGEDSFSGIREKICKFSKLPGEPPILFDLRRVHGKLYQEIYTLPKSEFMTLWYPSLFSPV